MKARDLMITPVLCVRPETTLNEAGRLLVHHGFAAMPVVDEDNRLIGMVSEADVLGYWRDYLCESEDSQLSPRRQTVSYVMSTSVIAMTPGANIVDMIGHLLDAQFRSIPIVDGKLLRGIVSRRDLLSALSK